MTPYAWTSYTFLGAGGSDLNSVAFVASGDIEAKTVVETLPRDPDAGAVVLIRGDEGPIGTFEYFHYNANDNSGKWA